MRRVLGILCVTLGAGMLVAAAVLAGYNTTEDRSAGQASQQALTQIQQVIQSVEETAPQQTDPYADHIDAFDEEAKEMTVKEIGGYEYIGYLAIPAFELELPVMSEWDYPRLRVAPCRQYGSTKTDDLVIAAHNYASHFGNLSKLAAGDLLTFTDMDTETILYEVQAVDILAPTAVETVRDSGFDLVLYTCTYGGENRIAAFCDRATPAAPGKYSDHGKK